MFVQNYVLIGYLTLQTVFGVDIDYYYDSALRSQTLSCKNRLHQMYCQIKCGMKSAFCIQSDCYCLSLTSASAKDGPERQVYEIRSDMQEDMDDVDGNEPQTIPHASQEIDQIFYAIRPTLRHHIAHFCPNLEVARECIKKCMVEGKPAFCGKDHVCYCGHKYSNTDDDAAINVKDTYAQFKDLYTKYFGSDATDTAELD